MLLYIWILFEVVAAIWVQVEGFSFVLERPNDKHTV